MGGAWAGRRWGRGAAGPEEAVDGLREFRLPGGARSGRSQERRRERGHRVKLDLKPVLSLASNTTSGVALQDLGDPIASQASRVSEPGPGPGEGQAMGRRRCLVPEVITPSTWTPAWDH